MNCNIIFHNGMELKQIIANGLSLLEVNQEEALAPRTGKLKALSVPFKVFS